MRSAGIFPHFQIADPSKLSRDDLIRLNFERVTDEAVAIACGNEDKITYNTFHAVGIESEWVRTIKAEPSYEGVFESVQEKTAEFNSRSKSSWRGTLNVLLTEQPSNVVTVRV